MDTVIFALGHTDLDEQIALEAEAYGDILLMDYDDSYENLTTKTLGGMRYMAWRCPHARYIMKVDADVFTNPVGLLLHLRQLDLWGYKDDSLLVGSRRSDSPVLRKGKYNMSFERYNKTLYPAFVAGPSYIMTRTTAVRLAAESIKHGDPWRLEDVYLTGILTDRLGFEPVQFDHTYYRLCCSALDMVANKSWQTFVFKHQPGMTPHIITVAWRNLKAKYEEMYEQYYNFVM